MSDRNPRRIVHVISGARSVGGAERVVAALLADGVARGFDQLVLNPFSNESSSAFAALCAPVRYECRPCDRFLELPSLRRWLQARIGAFRPDVVHCHLFQAELVLASLPRDDRYARVLTHHHGDSLSTRPHGAARERLDRWAVRRFDRVVAVSEAVACHLSRKYKYASSRVVCIRNGWEGEPIGPPRTQLVPTVICVGGFRPEKGHAQLLKAFSMVRSDLPDARLVLVGDGDLAGALHNQVVDAGLDGSVDFVGATSDVWSHLQRADVFATATLAEQFGIVIVEAMAAGLPVVAPATGGIVELVTPGVNGELFAPGDLQGLAHHLCHLLRSPDVRSHMGTNGRMTAQKFKMETTVRRYCDLYETLITGG